MDLKIATTTKRQVIDITDQISQKLPNKTRLINIFIKHTTAGVTTADLDPGTDQDFLDFLQGLVPNIKWRHPHDPKHAPDHLLSALIGPSVSAPADSGKLQLGAWQRIILVELDGPRERNINLTFVSSP